MRDTYWKFCTDACNWDKAWGLATSTAQSKNAHANAASFQMLKAAAAHSSKSARDAVVRCARAIWRRTNIYAHSSAMNSSLQQDLPALEKPGLPSATRFRCSSKASSNA